MYSSILVPIDIEEPSSWHAALPVAIELTRAFGAELHVVTVVRDIDAIWQAQYSLLSYEKLVEAARVRLTALIKEAAPHDLQPLISVGYGSVYGEILRIARATGADLIVMASHRPEMKDYLLGANAARVVRHAPLSVLVVRE